MKFVLEAMERFRNMSALAARYGISRKTGYVWLERYRSEGRAGLEDRSHRPRKLLTTSGEVVLRLVELRRKHRFWGPKKLRVLLKEELGESPSVKTIGRIMKRLELPPLRVPRKRKKPTASREGGALLAERANDVWTFDFKGWWKTKDGKRFEPLTVRDAATRFILLCVHCAESYAAVRAQCERLFTMYGVPLKVRVDNGPPFAAADAMGGLSRLSAWWVSLGIEVSFSRPATPSDNGAHERMHNDVWRELEQEPEANQVTQQEVVDEWVRTFNYRRPHEALGMRTPGSLFTRSRRRMKVLKPSYPADALVTRVSARGRIRMDGYQYFVGTNLSGMHIGIRRDADNKLQVLFYDQMLGFLESKPQRAR